MILTPAIIALLLGQLLAAVVAVYASVVGLRILRRWDIQSGSELQLALERKTYLVSSLLAFVLGFELFSLFLFVYTADHLHGLFVGAMCAAGTLNVNEFGYSALLTKLLIFFLCGVWLVLNYTDNRAPDYPLIRSKYKFLLWITALIVLDGYLEINYFARMEPRIITSCCGSLFSEKSTSLAGELATIQPRWAMPLLALSFLLTLRVGIHSLVRGNCHRLFAAFSAWMLALSLVSIISFVSLYFYELPTHHCPFCILQKEYHRVGYALYLALFGAGILGISAGVIDRFRKIGSLQLVIPRIQKNLVLLSMLGYAQFAAIAAWPVIFSSFKLEG